MKGTMCHIIKVGMNLLKIDIKKVTKDIIRDLNEEIPELIKYGYKFKITQLHSKKNIVVKLKFNLKSLRKNTTQDNSYIIFSRNF